VEGGLGIKQLEPFLENGSGDLGLLRMVYGKIFLSLNMAHGGIYLILQPIRHASRWWCDLNKVCEDGQGIILILIWNSQ